MVSLLTIVTVTYGEPANRYMRTAPSQTSYTGVCLPLRRLRYADSNR